MIVGKLGFGKDDFYYGLELSLHKSGYTAYAVTTATVGACDVLLVTMFWWRDIYNLEAFLRDSGIRRGTGKPWIIAGGMEATMTPEIIAPMVDAVFVGDADDHLGPILDGIAAGGKPESQYLYRDGDAHPPVPAECAPSAYVMHKGGARDVGRIEIARGCRFRCGFCALTGLKSYREVPFADVEPMLEKLRGKPVSLFAPERVVHRDWPKYQDAIERFNLKDHGQDVRIEGLHKIKSSSATFGLEGISFKLRKVAGKAWKQDYVLDRIRQFVEGGQELGRHIAYLSAYFIADLPGEDATDWREIWELFAAMEKAEWSRRLTFKPILNPFSPKPFTPLQGRIVHPFRPYETVWHNLLRKGGNAQWGMRIVETLVWGPFERVMDAIATNGKRDGYEVVRRIPVRLLRGKPPKSGNAAAARELLRCARKFGLSDERLRIDCDPAIPASAPETEHEVAKAAADTMIQLQREVPGLEFAHAQSR